MSHGAVCLAHFSGWMTSLTLDIYFSLFFWWVHQIARASTDLTTQVPRDLYPPPALPVPGDIERPPVPGDDEGRQEEGQAEDQHHGWS